MRGYMKLGEWNILKADHRTDAGMYLSDGEIAVLLPRKQVPEGLSSGQELRVFLYRDSEDRLIATVHEPLIELGQMKRLKVKNVTDFGAFLDWGLERDVFLPHREMTAEVKPGKSYLVRMYLDKTGRLSVSMKLYGHLEPNTVYAKNSRVTGTVYERRKGFGAFVAIDDRYAGLIHESEIFDRIEVGDIVTCRIVNTREDGKTDLAMREEIPRQMEEDAELLLRVIESYGGVLPFGEKADSDRIRKEFGISKNAFKRAVGHLLKEGKVETGPTVIRLVRK